MKKRTTVKVLLLLKGEEFKALEKIRHKLLAPSYKEAVMIAIQETADAIT